MAKIRNIVLIHGGFVDGSGWQPVHKILTGEGFNVRIVQNLTLSLADDVAVTKRVIASVDGPPPFSTTTSETAGPPAGTRRRASA